MNHYCTLFDSAYLSRGLALYESLNDHEAEEFVLFIFAFDDFVHDVLTSLKLKNTRVISLEEFEDDDLQSVKATRSKAEYCWTCTPSTILYCIERFDLPHCTYLDADLYFYSDPTPLHAELEGQSVLITEHRYTPIYDQSDTCGVYCVQFITFRSDAFGMKTLRWWREKCIEWCFARFEDGRFGDQKYLDDWPERFEGIQVMQHSGGAVAPWNVQQYDIERSTGGEVICKRGEAAATPLIFYHFHGLQFLTKRWAYLGQYKLSKRVILSIYQPYYKTLSKVHSELSRRFGYDIRDYINRRKPPILRAIEYMLKGQRIDRVVD